MSTVPIISPRGNPTTAPFPTKDFTVNSSCLPSKTHDPYIVWERQRPEAHLDHLEETDISWPVQDSLDLNLINLGLVWRHVPVLVKSQSRKLSRLDYRIQTFPRRFARTDEHHKVANIVALCGCRSERVARILHCSVPMGRNKSGLCEQLRLCSFCSWRKKRNAIVTVVPAFSRGFWGSLTLSWQGAPDSIRSSQASPVLISAWNVGRAVLRDLLREGHADGIVASDETKILSMVPPVLQGHVHAVVHSPEPFDRDALERASTRLYVANACTSTPRVGLWPSAFFKPIKDRVHLADAVSYLFKTMDVVGPYRSAWWGDYGKTRDGARLINTNAALVLDAIDSSCEGRRNPIRLGTLAAQTGPRFVGVRKADWHLHADLHKELDAERALQRPGTLLDLQRED